MSIIAAFKLENSGNDYYGNHNCTVGGSPWTTVRKKYGLCSGSGKNSALNYLEFADSLSTALAACSAMTITFWGYFPSGKSEMILDRRRNTANVAVAFQADGPSLKVQFQFQTGTWEFVFLDASYFDRWIRVNIEWTGADANLYLDGVLKKSFVIALNPFDFGSITDVFYFLKGGASGVTGGYYDQLIFTDQAEGGAEIILPIAVNSMSPDTCGAIGGKTVTINAEVIMTGAIVLFGSVAATDVTIVSSTELTCMVPPGSVGAVTITVTNTDTSIGTYIGFIYIPDVVFKPAREYEIKIKGRPITADQEKKFSENNELNIIDGYDFAFDSVDTEMPLEFRDKFLGGDKLEVFKNNIKVYKGYISDRTLDFERGRLEVKSLPMTDYMNKYTAAFDLSADNPVKLINYFFNVYLPAEYRVGNIIAQSNKLSGINVALDTDGALENVKALIGELAEAFDIGIYNNGLTIEAFAVPEYWPKKALDITGYLVRQPVIEEKTDRYYDKVILTYKTAVGAADATITEGTGDLTLEASLSNTYCSAAVAAIVAERKFNIVHKYYYTFSATVSKDLPISLAGYFMFDDYVFVVTGLENGAVSYELKGIGVLKT